MKNIIITHGNDVDGIVAGALTARHLEIKLSEKARVIFCAYPGQRRIFFRLAKLGAGRNIFISDVAAKDYLLPDQIRTVLGEISHQAEKVFWYDHHADTEVYADLLQLRGHKVITGGKEQICAAELVRRDLLPDDDYAEFLGRVAQAHDYPPASGGADEIIKAGAKLQKIISVFNSREDVAGLSKLVRLIARDDRWYDGGNFSAELSRLIAEFDRLSEAARENAKNNRLVIKVWGKVFVVTCASAIMPQKETVIALRNEFSWKVDGAAVYFLPPDGQLLFFKGIGGRFNAQKFCEFMGGGGREGNGGFTPRLKKGQGYQNLVNDLRDKLEEYLS